MDVFDDEMYEGSRCTSCGVELTDILTDKLWWEYVLVDGVKYPELRCSH